MEKKRPHAQQVSDVMTRKVFTLRIDKNLIAAKEIMEWAHTRHVPVVDADGKVMGMVSHRDLLAASVATVSDTSEVERKRHLWTIPLTDVLRYPVITTTPEVSVQEAAGLMRKHKIGCLPVIDAGKLVGIITEYDLLRVVEEL